LRFTEVDRGSLAEEETARPPRPGAVTIRGGLYHYTFDALLAAALHFLVCGALG
jgi:hypothetical protein